ncbi:MAG TPA: hypothetical protein VF608_14615 [Thermoanaerobaculia bacterium]
MAEVVMDRQEVIGVLESLANGLDPATGARIPLDAFHSADSVRALFTATALLRESPERKPVKRAAAGSPWNADEESRLGQEFDAGMSIAQIALQHGRSSGAITSRLVKLGRIDPATVTVRERGARA